MAKRTVTRAAVAAKKSLKASAATKPTKAAGSTATTKSREAAKVKPTKATAVKKPAVQAPSKTAAAKPAKTRAVVGKAPANATVKVAGAKPLPAKAIAAESASARKTKTHKTKTHKTKTGSKAKAAQSKPKMPRFLAAELGHPVDHDGEPIGAGSRAALGDTELQRYTLQLWRQMQSRRGVNTHIPAMERAGVTIDQIWTAGVTDRLTTSSSPDDVKRYRQKLLFRANLLESILTETVDELQRLGTIDPTPPRAAGEPG